MAIHGGTAQIVDFQARLRQAAAGGLRERLLKAAAAAALTQVQMGFKRSQDPYGKPWAKLKHRVGMPLRDTGRMGNSFTARPTASGFIVGTNVVYAIFHQTGTGGGRAKAATKTKVRRHARGGGGIPARPMVPRPGLSPQWLAAIEKAVGIALKNFESRLNR